MLVSIIIPLYNAALYVKQTLQSVACQTFGEQLECLLVDDCSTDDSVLICNQFISEYKGPITFRIVIHEFNRGASVARNTGIKSAKGKYIYFLDNDDRIVSNCIEMMLGLVKKYPDSQIVFAGATATSENYKWLDYTQKHLPEYSDDREWLQLSMLKRFEFGMTVWNKLVQREFITNNNLYFVEGLVHEDEAWNFEMSKYIQAASFVKANTYVYRVRPNSIMTGATDDIRWKRLFALWNVLLAKLGERNKQLQIRAISSCILEKTRWKFPAKQRIALMLLFWKLSAKSKGMLAMLLFLQGMLALCLPSRYPNHYTCSRIGL